MENLLTDIIAALRENPMLDASAVERLMRAANGRAMAGRSNSGGGAGVGAQTGEDTRPFTKRRLSPAFLRMPETNPELWAKWALSEAEIAAVTALLQVKPRRTMSGVATITLITRPQPCRGGCLFCPTEPDMPKSYLADEPACQRAVQAKFDPYIQVSRRLRALTEMGHPTGKVELIILGGTWDDYPEDYRRWFVAEAFRALNEFGASEGENAASPAAAEASEAVPHTEGDISFKELFALQDANADSAHRCVGLVVETRPDCITPESLTFARALGATKIQMGVQSLNEDILAANGRAMSPDCIAEAFALLRDFGFKSHVHLMLNLLGSDPETDISCYRTLMDDPRFRPDEVKLYPCMLIRGAALEAAYADGRWTPYDRETLTNTLSACLLATRPWTRVSRIIRDFSAADILAGDRTANLRQLVEQQAAAEATRTGQTIQEMRSREIVRDVLNAEDLQLEEVPYETATTHEVFLQWVTSDNRLAGFCRLSLPKAGAALSSDAAAMIREVHVYGRTADVGTGAQNAQHLGLGRQLIARAEQLAREAGFANLSVISAVGTRRYYERLGFSAIDGPDASARATLYQHKAL